MYLEKAADMRRYNKVCILFGKPAPKSDISYSVSERKQKGTRETFGKFVKPIFEFNVFYYTVGDAFLKFNTE